MVISFNYTKHPERICQVGKFGNECDQTCSETCAERNNPCDKRGGACSQGCDPGHTGTFCEKSKLMMSCVKNRVGSNTYKVTIEKRLSNMLIVTTGGSTVAWVCVDCLPCNFMDQWVRNDTD